MKLSDYDFHLPEELIARYPNEIRDKSRLLIVDRITEELTDTVFEEIPSYLNPGDCLVLNDSRVYPARIYGESTRTKRQHEFVLVNHLGENRWRVLVNKSKSCRVGDSFLFGEEIEASILEKHSGGVHIVRFDREMTYGRLMSLGEMALPPYILKLRGHRDMDKETYQTVYCRDISPELIPDAGSIAAPTAGLHFTPSLIERLKKKECLLPVSLSIYPWEHSSP